MASIPRLICRPFAVPAFGQWKRPGVDYLELRVPQFRLPESPREGGASSDRVINTDYDPIHMSSDIATSGDVFTGTERGVGVMG